MTVLLAAVVGVLVVVQNQRQADRVAEADRAGETFLSEVGTFQTEVARQVGGARAASPDALLRVLEAATADPPQLADAPSEGADQSASYAEALRTRSTFLEPYDRLRRELRRAVGAKTFVAAAREALDLRATDYVGSAVLSDSGAVRSRLVPAFATARDTFAAVRVPEGQEELASTVRAALQYVIDQATRLADSIDANRSFSFTYSEQFQAAIDAVDGYATTVDGDLAEAVNAVTGS